MFCLCRPILFLVRLTFFQFYEKSFYFFKFSWHSISVPIKQGGWFLIYFFSSIFYVSFFKFSLDLGCWSSKSSTLITFTSFPLLVSSLCSSKDSNLFPSFFLQYLYRTLGPQKSKFLYEDQFYQTISVRDSIFYVSLLIFLSRSFDVDPSLCWICIHTTYLPCLDVLCGTGRSLYLGFRRSPSILRVRRTYSPWLLWNIFYVRVANCGPWR